MKKISLPLLGAVFAILIWWFSDLGDSEPLPPERFIGCYGDGDFQLTIGRDAVSIYGKKYPFEIQMGTSSIVIFLPVDFFYSEGRVIVKVSEKRLYRLVYHNSKGYILITDQNGDIHEMEYGNC